MPLNSFTTSPATGGYVSSKLTFAKAFTKWCLVVASARYAQGMPHVSVMSKDLTGVTLGSDASIGGGYGEYIAIGV